MLIPVITHARSGGGAPLFSLNYSRPSRGRPQKARASSIPFSFQPHRQIEARACKSPQVVQLFFDSLTLSPGHRSTLARATRRREFLGKSSAENSQLEGLRDSGKKRWSEREEDDGSIPRVNPRSRRRRRRWNSNCRSVYTRAGAARFMVDSACALVGIYIYI